MSQLKPKFAVAANLNKLAHYLRFLGYDTLVMKAVNLNKIINICQKDRRVYLTRSIKESKSAHKFSRRLIKNDLIHAQLLEIIEMIDFNSQYMFTRCSQCNRELTAIDKEKIKKLIPEFVYTNNIEFKICRKCGKIYWKGSHYKNLLSQFHELKKQST